MPRGKVIVRGVECKQCGKRFSGLRNVRGHYKATGHSQFRNTEVERVRVNPDQYERRAKR